MSRRIGGEEGGSGGIESGSGTVFNDGIEFDKKNHFNSTINNVSGIGGTNILLLQSEIAEWRKRRRQRTREGGDWLEKWKRIGVEKSEDEKASSTSISKRERIP